LAPLAGADLFSILFIPYRDIYGPILLPIRYKRFFKERLMVFLPSPGPLETLSIPRDRNKIATLSIAEECWLAPFPAYGEKIS